MKYFTGVGSRSVDEEGYNLLFSASQFLSLQGYILRSGAAEGSDTAAELGVYEVNGAKEIYIPWKGFNKSTSDLIGANDKALKIASEIHPAWGKCSKWVRLLHARNIYQVLGKTLDKPSDLLICWTPGGDTVGGTATSLRLAMKYNIPIYNFGNFDDVVRFEKDFKTKISRKDIAIGDFKF